MANPWEEFQDDEADSATGTLTPEAIGPWSDFAEPEEEDEPWEAFKEPDPIGDYNSAAAIAEKFAQSRETNYAKYNELAQIPERTPEVVKQMVEAFNAGKQAEVGLYGEQDRLNTLRPEVDRIQAQRAEERRNQIESKRLDPAFGDSVADQLYQFDEQMAAEMEQARSIADIEERNTAFESIAKKYADQENGLIKSSAEGYANRFDSARETAWLLRQLEVNNKRAWADYGAAVAEGYGDIPFDMPDRPEGLKVAEEAWQGVKDAQNKNRAETEEAISKLVSGFPTDQQEQIRRDAEEWISVQKGEKEVAIVQGRPVFSKDVQGDYDRAKELVDDLFAEGEINEIQRTASIEALDATAAAEREDKLKFVRELPDYAQRAEGKTDDEVLEEYESSRTGFVSSVMDYFSGASEGFGGYIDMAVDGQRLRSTLDSGDEDQARELAFELIQKTIDKQQQNADPFRDQTAAMAGQVIGQVGAQITSQKAGELGVRGLSLAVAALLKSPTINQLGQQAAPWVSGAASAVANANIYGLDWFQTTVQDFLEAANVQNINDLSDDQKKQLYKEATDAFYASQLPSVTELIEPTMFLKMPKAARKSVIGRTIDGAINIGVEVGQEKFTEEWKEAYMRNAVSAHQAQSTMGMDDMKAMTLGLLPLGGAKFAVDTVRARREAVTERRLQDLDKADAARAEQLRAEQAVIAAAEEAANNAATVTPESADAMKQAVEAAKTDVETKITESLAEGMVRLPEDFITQRNQTVNQALERIRANDVSQILQDVTNIAVDEVVRPAEGLNPVTVRGLKDDVTYLENLINKNEFKVSEIDKTRFKTFMAPENYDRFIQVVESSPQEAIASLRGLVDDYVSRGEVPVEGAGGGEEEEARILPAVRTIADSIQDKDTFIYEGMRGALNEEDGEVVFRPFGTQEKYTVAVNPNQTLDQVEGIQWARRGQRRIRPEEERVETTTIVEQAPTVTTEEADTTEDSVQFPQALVEIERSPTLNFFANLFDTGESKVSQDGKRARKVSETPEFYRQVNPEQVAQANRLVDSALRIIDAMPISEDQKAELSEPFLLLDQDISTYESNPNYQRYKSSIVREVRPPVEAGAVPETEAEVAAGVTELEQRAAAEVSRLEQEAQARRVAAGQAAFVSARPADSIIRVARAEATPQEFESLVEQGLAEEYKGQQVITQAGIDALPENERPRLTPEARRIQIDTGSSEVVAEAISKGLRFGVDQVPPTFKMPEGWTLEGEIYTPPPRTAPEEVARIAEQYGVDEATATSIFNNEVFRVPAEMSQGGQSAPSGFFFERYNMRLYAIPTGIVKKRLAAQAELSKLSTLERAALSGVLTEQRLLNEDDAKRYIRKANASGFTADEIAAATAAAETRWNERFPDNGNAREVAGDVSTPVVDFTAEEAANANQTLASDSVPSSKLFDLTAREALRYIAGLNLGAQLKTAEGRVLTETQTLRRAASVLAKLPLRILDADFIKRARGGDRAYRANEGFIRVPATSGGQEFLVSIRTIIHEVAHTLTADAFRKYVADRSRHVRGKNYLNALDKALASPDTPDQVKRAINLYKQTLDELGLTQEYFRDGGLADLDPTYSMNKAVARKIPLINKFTGKAFTSNEFYALANLDEFVAQTWSSTDFQDLLKNIKVKNQPSIYERFVRLVRDLFGFESDTMAAAVIDATNSLAELEAPARGATVQERIDANLRAGMDVTTPAMPPTIQPTAPPEAEGLGQLSVLLDSGDFASAQVLVEGGATMDRATFLRSITPAATQRATTIHTRLERDGIISKDEFANEQGLVYGDGRGAASAYLGAESYEPFPPAGFTPDYSGDRVAGQGAPIDKKFRTILNTFVLNVVDPQTRSFIVKDIANLLEDGGRAVFVTRGTDVAKSKALVSFGPLERIQRSEGKLTYQKGFTQSELIQYLQETLGDGFEVRALRGGDRADVRVEVAKNTDATLENAPLILEPEAGIPPMAPPDPDINEEATPEEVTQTVTSRAEAKVAQEAVTGHSILADEIPTELNEEAQARYENGMALGDFLAPEFFNLGEAYKPYISAIWLNLNGGLMPTVKVEGKEIAKPEKGTTQAEALRLLKRATDILDSRSDTTGGKDLTHSLQDIMATWMDSGLGEAALKNAIVQFTNLDVAQATKTATDFARVYELAQDVTSAKERAQVRMERALPAVTNRQQREKERMIKLEEAAGTIDSISEAIRLAFDVNIKKPKTDRATEKKQIEEQLRQAKRIIREVVPRQYLGDQLLTLERATGLEGLKKVVEAAQNGLNEARLDDATARARKAYDRAQKAVKANEISPEAMAVLRDFVETYSKKGIGPETRAKIEDAMKRYEADPVGALEDLAVQKYLKQKGALQTIKIDKSLGLDALREIAAMVNSTLHADKVARGEMLFNKQQTRMELVDEISTEIDQVKSIAKARKDGGMGIGLFNRIALYKGARVENILRAFGLNKLREFVYDRLTLDAYNDELRVRRDLKKKIEARVKDITGLEIGTRDYDLWSKEMIELTGVDGSGVSKPIKIQRREFLDMVASLRDESNFRRAVNSGGYVIDRLDTAAVDTVKITPDTYFEILNKMGDQDGQMVDMMVDLYNNDLFSILENASLQAYGHGIKGVTGTYYPRTADKWTRTTETKKDMDYIAYYQRRVDDVGYLKERDEKAKSKLRAVDFLQRLDYHVTNDARIGAYLPIVRDIEMVLNDPKIARPLAQKIGEGGLKMIREMVRQQTTPPAGLPMGLLSTLVGNAGVGVLGFKLHAAMQNPVGIPIALAYYGRDGFKYLAKAFPYGVQAMKPKDRRDMVAVLSKYSPYYNERYGDGGFIQEFTSGLSNAPSDTKWRKNLETAAMSWLEGTDRWGALVRYKIAQQVVRDRTVLQDGTEEFNRAVANEWNRMMFRSENTAHGADRTGVFQYAGQNPVFKVFIMFQSAVSKQYSLFAEAMLQAQQGGRQNLQDAATKMVFLSISLAASKAISQAFYSLLFPPEDEEEREKTWAQLLGKVAGTPLSIVPVVGPTLQNFTESFFSPDQMRKPMQIDLISSFIFGIGDTLALTRKAFDQLTDEQIDEATGNAKFWETSYRALKKALAVGGIPTGVPAAGVVQTGELGLKLVENLRNVFNDEPKTEDFQKKVQEYEKSQKSEPIRQEMAKLYFAVTENDQKAFNRAYKDILKKRPDIKRSDLINSIRRRQDFRVVGMVRSGKLKQKDLEANGISRDYYLEQKALLRSVEKAAATMWRDAKDSQ